MLDGCFVAEALMLGKINEQESFNDDDRKDGELELSLKRYGEKGSDATMEIWIDMLKLENQLPLRALSILTSSSGLQIENIPGLILELCSPSSEVHRFSTTQNLAALHLLNVYRKALLLHGEYWFSGTPTPGLQQSSTRQGVKFNCSESRSFNDISFSGGVLRLPYVKINDRFEPMLPNLTAFEQLHCAGQEVTAYMFFMDGIVNTPKDLALLRENGIVKIGVGSDEDVTNLFNGFTKQITVRHERREDGVDVTKELNDYCSTRWHKWRADFVHTYLKNPWVIMSLLAAFILLLLTVIQTVYTSLSYYSA